ncbi:MAG TPA: peptidoglycan DD-metalloendopeptidase family protein [Rhodanobacteraceae bacterium]|nr:peptidoglycan DD-metalloendopeptidase family protein [Rhodanobacteraceae bacterium]
MHAMNLWKAFSVSVAAAVLLTGCASNPAPVVNHSFGGSSGQPASTTTTSTTQPAAGSGAQTFGLGGHANGTLSAAGYTVAPGDTLYSVAFANGMDVRELAAVNGIAPPYVIHPGQVLKLKPSSTTAAIAGTAVPEAVTTVAQAMPKQPTAPVFGPVTTQTMTAKGVAPASAAPAPAAPVATTAAPATTISPSPMQQPGIAAAPAPPSGATHTVAGIAWRWPAGGKVVDGFHAGSGGDGAGIDITGEVGEAVRAAASGTVVYSGNGLIGYGELIIIKHNDAYLSAYGHNSKRLVKEGQHVEAGQEIALMGASGAPRVELHFEIRKNGKPVDPLGYLPQR